MGFAIANVLDPDAPTVDGLLDDVQELASRIAGAMQGAVSPLVVTGVSCESAEIIQAAANVALALKKQGKCPKICVTLPECDTMGVALMGGCDVQAALARIESGEADAVIILENDLFRRGCKAPTEKALQAAKQVAVFDHILTDTANYADIVAPVGTFAESTGIFVNSEGRAQKFYEVMSPDSATKSMWRYVSQIADIIVQNSNPETIAKLGTKLQEPNDWKTVDDVEASLARQIPIFGNVAEVAPPSAFRVSGMKVARQSHRYSGRTSMHANVSVHEHKPPEDVDSPLAFSMEGYQGRPPSPVITRFWAPHWNSDQAVNKFQSEVGGRLVGGDPGKRLLEPSDEHQIGYFGSVPEAFRKREGQWLVVPFHEVFGSDELSALSPPVAERIPKPYLALNTEDARSMGLRAGSAIELSLGSDLYSLVVRIEQSLAAGVAGLPVGLKGVNWAELPAWGVINVHQPQLKA